jgi:hypothetical protein
MIRIMMHHLRRFWLSYVLAFLVLIAGAVAVHLAVDRGWSTDEFRDELGKAGMQLVVVALLGALVTAALQAAEHQREEARRRTEYRLGLLQRLRAAYGEIKRVRRQLEAAGFRTVSPTTPMAKEVAEVYVTEMAKLNEAQLTIEAIKEELEPEMGRGAATETLWCYLYRIEHHSLATRTAGSIRRLRPRITWPCVCWSRTSANRNWA